MKLSDTITSLWALMTEYHTFQQSVPINKATNHRLNDTIKIMWFIHFIDRRQDNRFFIHVLKQYTYLLEMKMGKFMGISLVSSDSKFPTQLYSIQNSQLPTVISFTCIFMITINAQF